MSIFVSKKNKLLKTTDNIKLYDLFLESIDPLSASRLRGIDMSLEIFKQKMNNSGFLFSEIEVKSSITKIKRNQDGYYVDETKSFNSKTDYRDYQCGLEFLNKYKDDFERIHKLLLDKEHIMDGYYKEMGVERYILEDVCERLGYGIQRSEAIHEIDTTHPSKEYIKISKMLDEVNHVKDKSGYIEFILDIIRPYFKNDYTLEIKYTSDKYGMDFDSSFGVMAVEHEIGNMHMLYEVDGFTTRRDTYEKYLVEDCPYLEIYLRLIIKCIKDIEDEKNSTK